MLSLAPNNIFNAAYMNNKFILSIADFLGLETVTKASQPIMDFFQMSIEQANPDPEGSFVDRYLWEMKKNEEKGNSSSAFYGQRGQQHLQSSVLDLFVAG